MLSRAADYALRSTITLAGRPPGVRMSLSALAEDTEVPPAFLYKVLRVLVESGLLIAHRGKGGGYELPNASRHCSVLDVVDALDGLPELNTCLTAEGCHRAVTCPAHPIWSLAQQRMREVLSAATLDDLVKPTSAEPTIPVLRHAHRHHSGDARERLLRPGGRACPRLRREDRLPAPPRGREKPGVLARPRGNGR
jgi:Rrf2 family protein